MKTTWKSVAGYSLLVLGYLLFFWLRQDPLRVEQFYSRGLYPFLMQPFSRLIGALPFSLAEFLVLLLFIGVVALVFYVLFSLLHRGFPKRTPLLFSIKKGVLLAASLYLIFQLSWGLNYHRISFAQQMDWNVQPSSEEELTELCASLTQQASDLRSQVPEDDRGIFTTALQDRNLYAMAQNGYDAAAKLFPSLSGAYGTPKGVVLSHYWSYTGTSGMYFPLTGEANINTQTPSYLIPAIISHEMAHQHGYAREDEANFIAYITTTSHPSAEFRYSGTMLALNNAMNQLHKVDPESWYCIRSEYSEGMLRDLEDHQAFRDRYQGKIWETSNQVNNQYLIFNSQTDGVQSYGRMVDLLLTYKRLHPDLFSINENPDS